MNAAESAKARSGNTNAFEIGQFDPPIITDHHVFNVATAVDKGANLSTRFVRKFSELTREFRRHDLVRSDPPGVELFYAAKLIRLEARCVSYYVLDGALPPFTRILRVRTASGKLT